MAEPMVDFSPAVWRLPPAARFFLESGTCISPSTADFTSLSLKPATQMQKARGIMPMQPLWQMFKRGTPTLGRPRFLPMWWDLNKTSGFQVPPLGAQGIEGAPGLHWPFPSLLLDPIPQWISELVADFTVDGPMNPEISWISEAVLGVGMRWSAMSEHGTQQHLSDFIQAFQQGNHFSKMASFVLFKNDSPISKQFPHLIPQQWNCGSTTTFPSISAAAHGAGQPTCSSAQPPWFPTCCPP